MPVSDAQVAELKAIAEISKAGKLTDMELKKGIVLMRKFMERIVGIEGLIQAIASVAVELNATLPEIETKPEPEPGKDETPVFVAFPGGP